MAQGVRPYGTSYVTAPDFTPATGGLLQVATVRTVNDYDPALRGFIFDSDSSETALGTVDYVTGATINMNTAAMSEGDGHLYKTSRDPFTVYGAFELSLPLTTAAEAQTRAENRLAIGESIAVEAGVWNGALPGLAAGNILNSGTATPAKKALGILAEYLGHTFGGVPYFHGGRRLSNELAGLQLVNLPDTGDAFVKGGGLLVNGGGYFGKNGPDSKTATADQVWLYGTGTPLLYRSPVLVLESPKPKTNREAAYALRTYVPAFDGPVAAILVDLS